MCFVAFLLIVIIAVLSLFCGENRFSPSPSHIVLSRWENDKGRKIDIINTEINDDILVKSKLDNIPCSQTQLIIKTDNLSFSLFTKGKIIYQNTDKKLSGYGRQIHIIDIRDIKKSSELCLYLSPVKCRKGRIEGDIFLSSKNDYLLDILCRNKAKIIELVFLSVLFISLMIIGITKLVKKIKTAPKYLYFSGCLIIISLIILLKSELYQFIFSASFATYILFFLCYPASIIFLISFIISSVKNGRVKTPSRKIIIDRTK